jgi:predicted dehydrogenase
VRWGIIGAGRIAKKVGAAMHTAPGHRITAVYGRRIDAAQVLAQEFSAVAFDDVGALLASQRCDAVYVALPNHLHAPITLQAIAAGLHVLVEKPLACTAAEVAQIQSAAQSAGVVVREGMMYQYHPQTTKTRELLVSGAIGAITQIHVGFGYRQDNPADIRMTERVGGGAIADLGCYAVHYARLMTASAVTQVTGTALWGGNQVDVRASALCMLKNDIDATFSVSFVGGFFQNARIIGYDGVIEIERPFTIFPDRVSTIRLWRGAHFAQLDEIAVAPCNHFVEQAVAFAHAVAVPAAERSPTSLLDSYANAQVIDAWRRSLTSGLREHIGQEESQ